MAVTTYEPEETGVEDYLSEQGYELTVVEAEDIASVPEKFKNMAWL